MADDLSVYKDLHVLIVDDETFVRTMVKQMLRTLGIIHIREADEGAAALKEAQLFPPDLIICDLNMEPIDGLVFVQMLRNHHALDLRNIPVIILSGKNDLASVKEATSKGINGYLVKPVSLRSLQQRLDSVLKSNDFVQMSPQAQIRRRPNDANSLNGGLPRPELKVFE